MLNMEASTLQCEFSHMKGTKVVSEKVKLTVYRLVMPADAAAPSSLDGQQCMYDIKRSADTDEFADAVTIKKTEAAIDPTTSKGARKATAKAKPAAGFERFAHVFK